MPREARKTPRTRTSLVVVSAKVDPSLRRQVEAYAVKHGYRRLSHAIEALLRRGLGGSGGPTAAEQAAYEHGLRDAQHRAYSEIAELMTRLRDEHD